MAHETVISNVIDINTDNINSLNNILDLSWGFAKTGIIVTAFELNLFDQINKGNNTLLSLSQKLKCDFKGITLLLDALHGMKLIEKEHNTFSIPALYLPYLVSNSPFYIGHVWKVHKHLNWDTWSKLTESIKTGAPVTLLFSSNQDQIWNIVIPYLDSMAKNCAREIAQFVKSRISKSETHLLDVGCGSGVYSQIILKSNPNLHGIGIDQKNVLSIARKQTEDLDLLDRLSFIEGDIFDIDYGTSVNDIVLLSNILHGYNDEECLILLRKAFNSLKPGGLLLINDFIISEHNKTLLPLLFSIQSYLVGSGRTFSLNELKQLTQSTGFIDSVYIEIPGPFSMLACKK